MRSHKRIPRNRTFNEKLCHILISEEAFNPLRAFVTDKEYVKIYISATVGEEYNIPTLSLLKSEDEIDSFVWRKRCVIKPTHSSGRVLFCENPPDVDTDIMKKWLKHNYYLDTRENNYKYLTPKIIVEPMLFSKDMSKDFKIYCVEGHPKMIKVDFDRYGHHLRKFYDLNWDPLPFSWNAPPTDRELKKPNNLEEIIEIAGRLCQNFSFIRVDLYVLHDRVYVGELTNCDGGAVNKFYPEEGERIATELCFGGLPHK